jgi:flavin reductase (DIM6/NTAB) family NADH-FMN oxidoreductase RutF
MDSPCSFRAEGWPPALVSFRDEAGAVRLLAVAWVGVACTSPALATIAFPCGLAVATVPPAGTPFVINLLDEAWAAVHLRRPDWSALGAAAQLPASWTLGWGEGTGAPLLADCPLQVECRDGRPRRRYGQCLLEGEVVTAVVDGLVFGLDGPLDLCRLQPLARRRPLHQGYLQPPG